MTKKKILTEQEIQSKEIIKKLDIKSFKDLKGLIGQIIKIFLKKSLETEFDEHMEYENMTKILEVFLAIIEKKKH